MKRRDGRILRPHIYRLDASIPTRWEIRRDRSGWLWIQLGRFQFTTHP